MADIKISDFTAITEISEAYVPVVKNGENYKVLLPEAIPSKTSDLSNDSGFITEAVGNLANYYLKTQTYTKEEVQALIGQITTINFEVVSALPATGAPNLIYLVPKAGSGQDVHDEYIWVDGKWELIGNTQANLTNYYTKSEADGRYKLKTDTDEWKLVPAALTHTNGAVTPSGNSYLVLSTEYTAGLTISLTSNNFNPGDQLILEIAGNTPVSFVIPKGWGILRPLSFADLAPERGFTIIYTIVRSLSQQWVVTKDKYSYSGTDHN